jgi:hypothetical protein
LKRYFILEPDHVIQGWIVARHDDACWQGMDQQHDHGVVRVTHSDRACMAMLFFWDYESRAGTPIA